MEEKTTKRGVKAGWTRHTIILKEDVLRRLQNCAYTERLSMQTVIDAAFTQYLEEYERTHEVLEKPKRD